MKESRGLKDVVLYKKVKRDKFNLSWTPSSCNDGKPGQLMPGGGVAGGWIIKSPDGTVIYHAGKSIRLISTYEETSSAIGRRLSSYFDHE